MKTNIEKKVTLLYLIIGITWIILSDKHQINSSNHTNVDNLPGKPEPVGLSR